MCATSTSTTLTGMAGEAAHTHLVDDGLGGRPFERCVAFPVKQQQLHAYAAAGKQAEIGATVSDGGAKRRAAAVCHNRVHSCSIAHCRLTRPFPSCAA